VEPSCEQLKAAELVVGVAAGVDRARDIVGAARAGLVDAIVTEAITAQAVLAVLDTPDGATGEPPRPVAEGP
jgi:DNA-binding transcriptional regulator LsrR (DeoR family)